MYQLYLGKSISKAVQAQIDEMQAYIGTQIIPDKIVVHRAEGYFGSGNPYGCLHTVTLPNGKTLDQALEEARLAGPSAIAKMEHEINTASTRHVATNNCFTSAFYNELQSQGSGKVVWELEVQKGAKGAFIEGNNFDGSISSECEIILQKDSKFQITSIKWDDSIQRWKVKAKVLYWVIRRAAARPYVRLCHCPDCAAGAYPTHLFSLISVSVSLRSMRGVRFLSRGLCCGSGM